MGQLLNAIKLVVQQMQEANPPAAVVYGVVTAVAPLSVQVDNRFTATGDMLIPLRGMIEGDYPATHTHKIKSPSLVTDDETETYLGLEVGEKVVLLRDYGGGRFVILGRV